MPSSAATSERLIRARLAAGFATSDAAALRLGVDAITYRRQELGRYRARPEELRRYAEALGVSAAWLLAGVGAGPSATE